MIDSSIRDHKILKHIRALDKDFKEEEIFHAYNKNQTVINDYIKQKEFLLDKIADNFKKFDSSLSEKSYHRYKFAARGKFNHA